MLWIRQSCEHKQLGKKANIYQSVNQQPKASPINHGSLELLFQVQTPLLGS